MERVSHVCSIRDRSTLRACIFRPHASRTEPPRRCKFLPSSCFVRLLSAKSQQASLLSNASRISRSYTSIEAARGKSLKSASGEQGKISENGSSMRTLKPARASLPEPGVSSNEPWMWTLLPSDCGFPTRTWCGLLNSLS